MYAPSPLYLLLLPLLLRLIPPPPVQRRPGLGVELGISAALGIGVALLCRLWLRAFHFDGQALASDFTEYCDAVVHVMDPRTGIPSHNRSRAAALLPGWLGAALGGPFDGLLAGALAAHALTVAAIYLWGRALHSRLAGLLGALASAGLGPLAVMGSTMSFYPEGTATFALATAAGAWALARPGLCTLLLAGAGAGLCLLVELRGLFWALPLLAAAGLGLLRLRPRWWLPGALALCLPLGLSWRLGGWAYEGVAPLERQAQLGLLEAGYLPGDNQVPQEAHHIRVEEAYLWGHSDLRHLPDTLRRLRQADTLMSRRPAGPVRERQAARVDPWLPTLLGAAALSILAFLRRPLLLLGLALLCLPYAAALRGAIWAQLSAERFLMHALPAAAALMGIAGALLAGSRPDRPADGPLRLLGATLLGLLLVTGPLSSPLGPARPPIQRYGSEPKVIQRVVAAATGQDHVPGACTNGLMRELELGGPSLYEVPPPPEGGP